MESMCATLDARPIRCIKATFVSRSRVILLRIDGYLGNYRAIRKFGHRNYSYEINSLRLFYVDNLL